MLNSLGSLLRRRRRRRRMPLAPPTVSFVAPFEPPCGACGGGCGLPPANVEGIGQIICPTTIGALCGCGPATAPWPPPPLSPPW
jgi:hypothetical protein